MNASKDSPPVSCVVSDDVMSFSLNAAEEIGVTEVLFWTTNACGFMGYIQYGELVRRGVFVKDKRDIANGFLDTTFDGIPGMPSMRLKDFPSFIWTMDEDTASCIDLRG